MDGRDPWKSQGRNFKSALCSFTENYSNPLTRQAACAPKLLPLKSKQTNHIHFHFVLTAGRLIEGATRDFYLFPETCVLSGLVQGLIFVRLILSISSVSDVIHASH